MNIYKVACFRLSKLNQGQWGNCVSMFLSSCIWGKMHATIHHKNISRYSHNMIFYSNYCQSLSMERGLCCYLLKTDSLTPGRQTDSPWGRPAGPGSVCAAGCPAAGVSAQPRTCTPGSPAPSPHRWTRSGRSQASPGSSRNIDSASADTSGKTPTHTKNVNQKMTQMKGWY